MEKEKKVFLSFVGNRDPYAVDSSSAQEAEASIEKSEGSVLSLYRHLKPDYVYLFPSSEGSNPTLQRAEEIKSILKNLDPAVRCEIFPLRGDDPTDFETLSQYLQKNIQIVSKQLGDLAGYSFHVNCSSGTQQMTSLAYVFADSGIFPGVERWQCKDPKYSTPENRIRPIHTTFIEEHTLIKKIQRGADIFAFQSMAEDCALLAEKNLSSERKDIALFLAKLFKAYAYHDILRHQEAYNTVKGIPLNTGKYPFLEGKLKEILESQIDILKSLQNETLSESCENLTDLYFNMQRCYDRGAYTDVLARFWRVGEGTVYFRLSNRWGINPRDLGRSYDEGNFALLQKNKGSLKIKAKNNEFIGFDSGRRALLEVFKDKNYEYLLQNYLNNNKIKKLIKYRNNTIVAHGMKSVSQDQAEECLEIAKAMLLALVPGFEKAMEKYPFCKENLGKVVKILDRP
nr:hypothetical protein [uncultured Dethiosulfovibrio sp.]